MKKLIYLWAFILPISIFVQAYSQVVRKAPTTITKQTKTVFKGTNIVRKGTDTGLPEKKWAARSLTQAEKAAALKDVMTANGVTVNTETLPVAKYAILNAQTFFVEDRAFMVALGRMDIWPSVPMMRIDEGELRVYIKPDRVNGWYLLDCNVSGYGSTSFVNPSYEITGPDGTKTTVSNHGDDHLQMFMISKNLDWQPFSIKRKGSFELSTCEVTTPGN